MASANPPTIISDEVSRMLALLSRAEARVQRTFLQLIGEARGLQTLEEIATLIETGQVFQALRVLEDVAPSFADSLEAAYAAAGLSTAEVLRQRTNTLIEFNSLNERGVIAMQAERARLIQGLNAQQQAATLEALTDGVRRGLAPMDMARTFRDSLGLTAQQQRAVDNFRRVLEQGDARGMRTALTRSLRDKRSDRSIERAIANNTRLPQAQIDRMVERYRVNMLVHRSQVIAQTESLRAINIGDEEMWQQAVDAGVVAADDILAQWNTVGDSHVRGSHVPMQNQIQPFGQPFISGDGNRLRFPGDPLGPADDTINCRCVVARNIPPPAESAAVATS